MENIFRPVHAASPGRTDAGFRPPLGQGQVQWGMLEGRTTPLGHFELEGECSRLVAPTWLWTS